MSLRIGQRILCTLGGSDVLSEQTIAGFTAQGVRLVGGDVIRPAWVLGVLS